MDILPILATLRRHKITALLIVLEIALTCAIVCNAVFLIAQRMHRMDMPSGVAEHELVQIQVVDIGDRPDAKARGEEDLAALRAIPGVKSVARVNQLPFTDSSWNNSIFLSPTQTQPTLNATMYFGIDVLKTLGAQVIAGRDFNASEYAEYRDAIRDPKLTPHVIIITRALAQKLWPGESALGKTIYFDPQTPLRVIGVVAGLIRPSLSEGENAAQWSTVVPLRFSGGGSYVLRTDPGQRERVIRAAVTALKTLDPKRIYRQQRTLDDARAEFFQGDRAMTGLLVGVIVALLLVTGLGIVGLASFWVAQRRRTIGVRRALGATRADILHYFQTENFLLATIGIALGMVLAYGINLVLMLHYELPRLPWFYFPAGAVALWLIGQLAVLGPALRAAAVPPVVATRTV
ncbi:MAG TPA: FtsX-like permease family protein [Rhodanobacteraceae bacterium]|nr:FtsX-like permease family protein [Rhodanobacteraceae bacterium]